jgi:glycosyltransferase involved in cell wall biosynthesis
MAYPFHVDIHGIFVNRFLENFEKQIDLVHVHMPLAPAVHTRLPIVTTFHTPHFADFFSTDLVNFRQYLTKGLEILDYRIEKSLISSSSVIGTVSEGVKRDLEHYYPIGSRTVKVFGNAVSDKLLEAGRPLTTHKDEFMILNVGRLDYRKGLLDLIESMRFVTARVPKARLVLIGKGPMLSEIIKKVIELNLQKQVEIKGFVSSDQVLAAYLRASIFVLPSHYEGLATVSLEAMACRAAVVATDVRGNSEVVKSGHTGLLVPKKDPRALGDAIVYLLQQSDLRERLASSARKLIEENFTWEKVTDRVLEAYSVAMR